MSGLDGFRAALRRFNGSAVALDQRHAQHVLNVVGLLAAGQEVSNSALQALQRPARKSAATFSSRPTLLASPKGSGKTIAIVGMRGIANYDYEAQPFCFSTPQLARTMNALAADPQIEKIVLDIDTPGGMVTGTQEAAAAVYAATKKKPVIGLVNPLCASAGYWIASQCTEIVGVPSADIGSIGVFMCHYDCSAMLADAGIKPTYIFAGEYKVEGNSSEPLSDEGKAWFQSEVNTTYRDFTAAVARGRRISRQAVLDNFGKGRCFAAPMAKKVGMIDSIAPTSDVAISQIVSGATAGRSASIQRPASVADQHRARLKELERNPNPSARRQAELARHRLAILRES